MFSLTEAQQQARALLNSFIFTLLFGGSRSGKTFIIIRNIVMRALKEPNSRHAIFRQTRKDLKESIWLDTFPKVLKLCFPGVVPYSNEQDFYVKFTNGSEIWFGYLDDNKRADNVLGKEYNTIYLNEISEMSYKSFAKVQTRLSLKNGLINKLYADCNPPGKWHWGYKVFIEKIEPITKNPLSNPKNYGYMLMNPMDNMANLPQNYLDILENLPEDEKNRFLLGLWVEGISGGIYTKEMALAEQEERITTVAYNSDFWVYTVWDIGIDDSTAIWFVQFIGDKINLIRYYQNNNEAMPHYLAQMQKYKEQYGYNYGTIFLPHDGRNREWIGGKSRKDAIEEKGYKVEVYSATEITEGINAVKMIFNKCYFDKTNCEEGISALSNYRRKEDAIKLTYSTEPVHDWASHGSDAFRLIPLVYRDKLKETVGYKKEQEAQQRSLQYATIKRNNLNDVSKWG